MKKNFKDLNNKIILCKRCPRLVKFRKKIATEKRKQYKNDKYWGKPITGFGDFRAKILMIGLAPAAHGGNRTGRVFTGDKSADFLFRCLYQAKLSNQPSSIHKNDGLVLYKTYLTTALKCVPPEDKPTAVELKTCFSFFKNEINLLPNVITILALGKIAFDACVNFYSENYKIQKKDYIFSHGEKYKLPDNKILMASYHPSPRNVNTGRINDKKMIKLLEKVKKITK